MMFWYGGHWAWWQGGLMWIGMIVVWGLLIWGAYALITNLTRKPPHADLMPRVTRYSTRSPARSAR